MRIAMSASVLCAATLVAGCAGTAPKSDVDGGNLAALEAREAELSLKEAELRRREAALNQVAAVAPAPAPAPAPGANQELPPNALSGECYARIYIDPVYETVERKVKVKDASDRIEIVPAEYAKTTEQVVVSEASEKIVVIPAVYGTAEERVLVEPAKKKVVEIPAVYETITEKVLVRPARKVWKQGRGPIQKIDEATGEIMCLVDEPAEYETVKRRVLKTPATLKEVVIPAKYKVVKKKVVKTPATTQVVKVPPAYKTVEVVKMVKPAQEVRVPVPAEFDVVTERKQVAEGRVEWRSILCETNTTPARIRQIQLALKKRGFDPGAIDGVVGSDTMRAVNAFQAANKLPKDKYLNVSTLRALGVSAN